MTALPVAPIGTRLPLLIGLLLAALTLRPQVVGIGPLIPDVQAAYGIPFAVAGLLVTIPVLCLGVIAPIAPVVAGRLGAVRAVTVAVALIAAAGVLRLAVPGVAGLLGLTLVIGVGMGLGNALMVVAVKERFADHPLLLTSVYSTGIQIGSALASSLAVPLAMALGGWRFAMLAFSVASALALLGWVLLSRGAPYRKPEGSLPRFPLRSGLVWSFAVMFGLLGVIYYGMTAWIPAAYVELGFTQAWTGWLAALFNLGAVPSTVAVGLIGERMARRTGLVAASAAMLVAALLIAFDPGDAGFWMVLAGMANGAIFALVMTLPLDVADSPVDVGAVAAMMLVIGYLVTATAPTLLGALRDLTGDFDLVLLAFPAAAAVSLVLAATLSPTRLARGVRDG